jgi:hypothetical protein
MTRVYFQCRDNRRAYQDDVVVLAEGLRAIGVEVFGNCNYWQRSLDPADFLVRHDPRIGPDDCDIYVVSYGWTRWMDTDFKSYPQPVPDAAFRAGRRYRTVYLDYEDGYRSGSFAPEYRRFDAVFRTKYNERCLHPANHIPWAMGLSPRMIAYTADALPWAERARDILVNFNASHPYVHSGRALMDRHFTPKVARHFRINTERDNLKEAPADPLDRLFWEQTQQRHSRSFYARLGRSQAVSAFCGELAPPAPFEPYYLVGGGRRARYGRKFFEALSLFDPRPRRLIQWDSWRFWEALAAGCLVFNFDLPHYGVKLPAMPENFVHYIGVRPDTVDDALARLAADPGLAERIARQGRAWVMEHYSPAALARAFVQRVESLPAPC